MAPRVKSSKAKSKSSEAVVATGPAPPGGPIEIVFSFDTTGSMSGCIAEVRTKITEVIERLFSDIPGLRIAVFAHGDYCDASNYVTKWVDFTSDQKILCDFVENVKHTGGGDWEECYELVLRQVREELSWTPGTQRSLVMIGDAIPHSKTQNKKKIDWKEEVEKLSTDLGVKIYSVQCQYSDRAADFWKSMADMSNGRHVKLEQFQTAIDMIMSVCYRETGPDFFLAYEKEVRAREGDKMRSELNLMFDALRDASTSAGTTVEPAKMTKKLSLKRKSTVPIGDLCVSAASIAGTKAGKVVKAKKTTMAKKSSTTKAAAKLLSAAKGRKYSLKRSGIKRERIRTSQFAPELNWTKWYPAFQQNKPTVAEDSWSERKGKHPGFRHHNLFYHDTKCAGLYEFAVQPKPGSWKYPVWSKVTKGFNSVYWDTYLIRNGRIQNQMNDVISKGSKIFVRRAVLKTPLKVTMHHSSKRVSSVDELRKVMNEVYDYAWSRQGKKTATERDLEKSGVLISQAKFPGGNA